MRVNQSTETVCAIFPTMYVVLPEKSLKHAFYILLCPHILCFTRQDKYLEWRNLTLFLAAFGGACVPPRFDPSDLTALIPIQFLPDSMRVLREPDLQMGRFLEMATDLLVVDAPIRDVAREAFGLEMHSQLYSSMLESVEE